MLADNPDLKVPDVIDSRSFGPLPLQNILGAQLLAHRAQARPSCSRFSLWICTLQCQGSRMFAASRLRCSAVQQRYFLQHCSLAQRLLKTAAQGMDTLVQRASMCLGGSHHTGYASL